MVTIRIKRAPIEVTRCSLPGQRWTCDNCGDNPLPEVWHISSLPVGDVSTWLCVDCLAQLTDAARQAVELHARNQERAT